MYDGKKIDANAHKGDAGIALIHRCVSQMGHVWHERSLDAGIDGTIELRDPSTGEMSQQHILVQSKASDRFAGEDDSKFHFICRERDVEYWMKAKNIPVLLVCSHPETGEAWWVHVQAWFSDPAHRASLRVDFNKATQRFDRDLSSRLFTLTDPHGSAHTPTAQAKTETLVSNLLPVDFPDVIYSAQASTSSLRAVFEAQRKSPYPVRNDFVLSHGRIYAWAPIAGTGLVRAALTAENQTPVGELLAGSDDDRKLFVRLLGAALQHDLRDLCRWNQSRRFIHFRATPDLAERRYLSVTGRRRQVFKGFYQRKDDPSLKQFYRHAALRWGFIDLDGEWFCQLSPDYFFTQDGYRESAVADEYLAKMKVRERNPAVLGETQLWAGILRGETTPSLLDGGQDERILSFGDLLTFKVDKGIDDNDWAAPSDVPDHPDQMALDFDAAFDTEDGLG